ncbi:MAG: hypothetical protein R3E95_16310 [Thiolinea sp.]
MAAVGLIISTAVSTLSAENTPAAQPQDTADTPAAQNKPADTQAETDYHSARWDPIHFNRGLIRPAMRTA